MRSYLVPWYTYSDIYRMCVSFCVWHLTFDLLSRVNLCKQNIAALIPKNGSLSQKKLRFWLAQIAADFLQRSQGFLRVKPSRDSRFPRTLKEIHWSVIRIGFLRNGILKNSSFPKSRINPNTCNHIESYPGSWNHQIWNFSKQVPNPL